MCVCILCVYHPPSIFTLTHSLRSFVASPVKSYGVNAGVVFCRGVCAPYWFIERSSRRWGAVPPEFPPSRGGTPSSLTAREGADSPGEARTSELRSELTNVASELTNVASELTNERSE